MILICGPSFYFQSLNTEKLTTFINTINGKDGTGFVTFDLFVCFCL